MKKLMTIGEAAKIFVYKTHHPVVPDDAAKYLYELAMTYGIKEAFQVGVNYIFITLLDSLFRSSKGIMTASPGSEAIARLGELPLIEGSQRLIDGLLH